MAQLSPQERRAMQYWGPIESITRAGGSTADLWEAINAHAQSLGYDSAGITALDVNRLRSQAVALREAGVALGQLGAHDLITGAVIGTAPWARDLNQQNAVPMWQVRFEHLVEVRGELQSFWRTSVFTGSVPQTRAELEEALEEDGENLAGEYEQAHVGIGSYTVMAV